MTEVVVMAVMVIAFTAFFSLFVGLADTLKWYAAIVVVGSLITAVGFVLDGCSGS